MLSMVFCALAVEAHAIHKNKVKTIFLLILISFVGAKINRLLELREEMHFELIWDGACSIDRVVEYAPKGMDGFVLGTTVLFGKKRGYGHGIRKSVYDGNSIRARCFSRI